LWPNNETREKVIESNEHASQDLCRSRALNGAHKSLSTERESSVRFRKQFSVRVKCSDLYSQITIDSNVEGKETEETNILADSVEINADCKHKEYCEENSL